MPTGADHIRGGITIFFLTTPKGGWGGSNLKFTNQKKKTEICLQKWGGGGSANAKEFYYQKSLDIFWNFSKGGREVLPI